MKMTTIDEKYLVIKTSKSKISECGSLFEAARGHWKLNINRASKCTHAILALVGCKEVKDVYKIDKWYPSTLRENSYVFSGSPDEDLRKKVVGKKLNKKLTQQGQGRPTLYTSEDELLDEGGK
jgi:hypothetical protein